MPCEDSEKVAIYKPERGLSPGTELIVTLILDFSASRPTRNMHLLFKSHSLQYFVIGNSADGDNGVGRGFEHVLGDLFTGKPPVKTSWNEFHAEWNKRMQGPSY